MKTDRRRRPHSRARIGLRRKRLHHARLNVSGWQTALCSALHGALSLPNIETVAAYEPLLFSRPAQPG
jgi:hypothetical protein